MSNVSNLNDVQWLFFDVFGTVVDWQSHMSRSMLNVAKRVEPVVARKYPDAQDKFWQDRTQQWRTGFMSHIKTKQGNREEGGIDVWFQSEVHRMLLDKLLEEWGVAQAWDENARSALVKEWHRLQGWPDSVEGLKRLRERFILCTLTNGDTAVMIEMCRGAGLSVDNHIAGDSIGTYKPDPAMYQQGIRLSRLPAGKCAMVAAHAYDLDAAKSHGMKTIYIKRRTEDTSDPVSKDSGRGRFDMFIDIEEGGLVTLAKEFGY
ncbi:hypothetical protein QFC21_007108 [Naganishia friedmannii]|uniref:Uncharacterized protein n=1 Tax=Naganishia friedmannii TaxID=89922 RepID=A0ACC2UXY8_9TREE|nr:hypothetical protein QFC21_007108 [Naganishia friedmannii]